MARYNKHTWNDGEAILASKLNAIETALADASDKAYDANDAFDGISGDVAEAQRLAREVSQLINDQSMAQNASNGNLAWGYVKNAIGYNDSNGTIQQSLDERFTNLESADTGLDNKIDTVATEVRNARRGKTSLLAKITEIDGYISDVQGGIHDLETAKGLYPTLLARLNAEDNAINDLQTELSDSHKSTIWNKTTASTQFTDLDSRLEYDEGIIKEVVNAHESTALGKTGNNAYESLDARFEAIESELVGTTDMNTRLDTLNTNVVALQNGKIDKTSIVDGFTTETSGVNVLDAHAGKTLNDAISAMDTAYKAADTALDARLDSIDGGSALATTNGTLAARVAALETEVDMTSADSRIDIALSRIDAIDNNSTGTVTGLDTRLTTAEGNIETLQTAVGSDSTGLTGRVSTLENTIGDASTGLAATKAIADAAKSKADTALQPADISSLTSDVNILKDKDTIVIDYDGTNSNYTNNLPNISSANIKANADYLIADNDGKYFYWRYINNNWELISAAGNGGGTGTSSGMFAASLSSTDIPNPDANTDYFVGNNVSGYTHYRYIASVVEGQPGTFVRILPNNLMVNAGVDVNGGLEAYTINDTNTNVFDSFVAFKDVEATPIKENDVVVATDLVFTDTKGVTHTARVQGGGSGASTSAYSMRLNNTLSSLKLTVPKKDGYTAEIKGKVVVKDSGVIDEYFDQSHTITADISYSLNKNGPWTNFDSITVYNNTEFTVDVTSILNLGITTYVRVVASTLIDEETKTSSLIYEVTQVEMSIAAVGFNQAVVRNTNFNFQYRCIGSGLTKEVHFLIDGTDIAGSPITTTLHNDIAQQAIPVTGLAVGMHSFQVYFTVNGIESNRLNYYIIYNNDNTRVAPLIALAAEKDTITYGDDLKINYTVATIGQEKTDKVILELYALDDSTEVPYASAELTGSDGTGVINEQVATWRPTDYPLQGTAYVRATAIHTVNNVDYTDTKTIEITINALVLPTGYSLQPDGTENLVYSYSAYGRTNNDADKEVYHYDYTALGDQTIEWTGAFNGFNWSGDGYVDGEALTISGGATHTVNVPIFQHMYNNINLENVQDNQQDICKYGRTIEIEYEVESATNLNDVIIDFMANVTTTTNNGVISKSGTGFQVTPQSCYLLKTGSTVDTDSTGFILNESDIAAAYLTPGTRTHLAFVIEPWSEDLAYDQSYHQSVNIYVNGEFANACPYVQGTDSFSSSATLRIGSSSCIIKLYQIRMYNRGLSHKNILQNYKVSPASTRDKLRRLSDNDILNTDGLVDYEKARKKYTCLLLTGPAPVYTTTTGGETVLSNPTISPYKGYPSPAGRKDKKTGEAVGKTESGVTLTKANPNVSEGYDIEFDLRDTVPTDQSIEVPAYIGARGAYVSSNNVQGTSSQKYPVHNLKVYLAKWQGPKTTITWVDLSENEEVPEGTETRTVTKKQVPKAEGEGYDWVIVEEGEDTTGLTTEEFTQKKVTTITAAEIKKVKYSLKGKDEHGDDIGYAESTLCWKADYMSTDHANTFNANIADGLFTDTLPGASWGEKHQNTVYGIRCLLFQKQGNAAPEFLGDGCLNNDKGNNKTYDLERDGDEDADTASQKWEFTNNSDDLGYFKTDTVFRTVGEGANAHIQAKDAFESTYPDEGDLKDDGLEPNYNHLQILITWLSKRANYWDETDPTARAAKKQIFIDEFEDHINMDHALTYYLFSEYVALCDNRVKNMFFRSDNVKSETIYQIGSDTPIFEGNSNPNADFFKNIDAIDTGTTQQVAVENPETHEISYETQTVYRYELHNRDQIDWNRSAFAIWAPVLYDLDSCFGVENVGYIRVRYDANWDYTWNNAPQFNGYESRLWLQFADCFDSEIKAAALRLYNRTDGLNYTNFYRQQITGNLENISPALSNQDMLIKFDKPWSEGFINYSLAEPAKETPYYKYLQRGSRTAQKTQFMNMRSKLLSSKYGANEFKNDAIKFRTGVPVGQSDLNDTKITIKSNQVMYPGVAYGDNKDPTRATSNGGKVIADQSCDIYATSPVQGNDGIFICGASMLTDIGDLSAFRPYQVDVGAGVNLKRLIVGSNAAGYTNGNTDGFMNLNKCILLEEVNIRNCTNVATLDLSNNALIKKAYAGGSGATTIIFPNGGVLNTVEYSAVTGNITILNQKNLTNFSYENSNNNHYAALTKLWIENTPNVPIVEIINTALAGLTGGVRLTGIDVDLYVENGTEQQDAAALETTTLFLNTLVSDVAKGKYLDSSGAFVPGNTNYPHITGKVHIKSIRTSLLNKLNTLYPNLIIYNTIDSNGVPANNTVTEYRIDYYNEGELVYTDYRTGFEHFIDPACDIDPITGKAYLYSKYPETNGLPTKAEDEQYKYSFGTYSNGTDYDRYSGWVKQYTETNPLDDDYPQGNTVFVAYYPTTQTQSYVINWYEEPTGQPILSYSANYGVDISTYQQPEERSAISRVKIDSNTNKIKVFKGWDRPVGKLTGNTNVYAQWEISDINNGVQSSDIVMSELTAADLAAIARLGPEAKRRILEDKLGNSPIMVKMGRDFDYEYGVNTTDLLNGASKLVFNSSTLEAKVFDGTNSLPVVKPLSTNSDWTLAIDYKFLLNQSLYSNGTEYVLVSCYSNVNSSMQGFKLSLVKNNTANSTEQYIKVSWGNNSAIIDYLTIDPNATDAKQYARSYRNMIVLRHKASDQHTLYLYYTKPDVTNSDATFGANIGITNSNSTLTWSNSSLINTPLILGGNYENPDATTPTIENNRNTCKPAKGIIYWAKFWDKDLGEKNCNALAAWPHETVPFFLSGYDNNTSPDHQILTNTNLTFIAAQAVGDRYAFAKKTALSTPNGQIGWRESDARKICNNRIYQGMSTAYQSIILTTSVDSVSINTSNVNDVQVVTTPDYFYLPAECEIGGKSNVTIGNKTYEVQADWPAPWPWLDAANLHNWYGFVQGTSTLELQTATTIAPFLYRFIGNYIKPTARIFNINQDPYNNGNTWTYNNSQISVQSGDIWINGDIAFIYYTNAEINEGIYVDIPTAGGGWKKADIWHLRTYNVGQNYAFENFFEKVEDNGTVIIQPTNKYRITEGRILCPEFSI